MLVFASCEKENMDDTTVTNPNGDPDPQEVEVDCETFSVAIENADGSLLAITDGGTEPFTYAWSTEESTSEITATEDGTFSVTVTDTEGCTAEASVQVEIGDDCAGFGVEIGLTPAETLIAEAYEGTPPYTYEWNTGETTAEVLLASADPYTVTVLDANGCSTTSTFDFGEFPCSEPIMVDLQQDAVGNVVSSIFGGNGPFAYDWSTGESTANITVSQTGNYTLTVVDSDGCVGASSIFVELVDPCAGLESNIDYDGAGTLTAVTAGGAAPYQFTWSNGAMGESITVSTTGTYMLYVSDANGCTSTSSLYVVIGPSECDGAIILSSPDGSINLQTSGEAMVWIDDCAQGTNSSYNYLVYDSTFDFWGAEEVNPWFISDGVPGFCFGSNSPAQAGDVLDPYFIEPLFYDTSNQQLYNFANTQIVINEAGSNVGDYISGTISGTYTNHNNPAESGSLTGTFCLPIVSICD